MRVAPSPGGFLGQWDTTDSGWSDTSWMDYSPPPENYVEALPPQDPSAPAWDAGWGYYQQPANYVEQAPTPYDNSSFWNDPYFGSGGTAASGAIVATKPRTAPGVPGSGGGGDVGGLIGALGKALSSLFGKKSAPKKATVVAPQPTGLFNLTPNTQMLVVVGLIGAAAFIAMRSGSGRGRRRR